MRPVSRVYRNAGLAALAVAIAACGACRSSDATAVVSIRLIDEPAVERRAGSPVEDAIRTDEAGAGPDRARLLEMRAPARVIWSIRIPSHARLRTAVVLIADRTNPILPLGPGVTVRVGIADKRNNYEELAKVAVPPSGSGALDWRLIDIDLGAYGGFKWSLFYRPSETPWRINFSVDAIPGAGTVAWREPVIVTR